MKGDKSLDPAPLFQPVTIGKKSLRNRIIMPPMVVNRGLTTQEAWQWYGRRAAGGVAMVIVEATNSILFPSELTADNLHPLVEAIHQGGALAAIQVFPGRRGQSTKPADLTLQDIDRLVDQFRIAAEICAAAGFDGFEPHGAHGFLLNQFISPVHNLRSDDYGGSLENRMRLALRIVETVRPITRTADMLLLYRHTPVGDGYGFEESLALAEKLVAAGVDILDISPASDAAPGDRAAPFMRFGVPVIAVNRLDEIARALEVLHERRATLIAIGRGLIADPDWPIKVREGRLGDIVACTRCGQCSADLRQNVPVGCPEWYKGQENRS